MLHWSVPVRARGLYLEAVHEEAVPLVVAHWQRRARVAAQIPHLNAIQTHNNFMSTLDVWRSKAECGTCL